MEPSEYVGLACGKAGASHVYGFVCRVWDALPCSKWIAANEVEWSESEERLNEVLRRTQELP